MLLPVGATIVRTGDGPDAEPPGGSMNTDVGSMVRKATDLHELVRHNFAPVRRLTGIGAR